MVIYSKNNKTRSGNLSLTKAQKTLGMVLRVYNYISDNSGCNISQITENVGYSYTANTRPILALLLRLDKIKVETGNTQRTKLYYVKE